MPVSVGIGSMAKSASTSVPFTTTGSANGSITGLAFQPKALLMFGTGSTSTTGTGGILRPSFGFSGGNGQNVSVGFGSTNKTTTIAVGNETSTFRRVHTDHCLALGSSGSGATGYTQIKVNAFTSDGAHLTYDGNDTGTWSFFYVALGGTDITNVKAGSFTLNNVTGNQDITDVGFEPDMVFFLGGDAPAVTGTGTTAHLSTFLGAAKNASNEVVMSMSSLDNLATSTDTGKYQRVDRCIAFFTDGSTSTIDAEAEYVSTVTGGFRINVLSAPANQQPVLYLAIKGGSWNVSNFTTNTALGTQTVTVPDSHTPKGLFTFGTGKTAGTTAAAGLDYSVGTATSSTAFWSNTGRDIDAATINNSTRAVETTSCIRYFTGTSSVSPTVTARGDLQATFAANQFAIDWLTAPASALQQLYVTVGDNVGASLVKVVPTETVGLTEASNRIRGRSSTLTAETVSLTETTVRIKGKTRTNTTETVSLTENVVKLIKTAVTTLNLGGNNPNLILNQSVEDGCDVPDSWVQVGANPELSTWTWDTTQTNTNTGFGSLRSAMTGNGGGVNTGWRSDAFDVTTGSQYLWSTYYKGTVNAGATARYTITWYSDTGATTVISQSDIDLPTGTTSTWRWLQAKALAPATAIKARISTFCTATADFYIDNMFAGLAPFPEIVGLTEGYITALARRRVLPTETLGLTEVIVRRLVVPTQTLQATSLQLRFSGGAANAVTTSSRGGAMSSVSVTDNTINNTWDDVSTAQASSGLTEYRCYYVYNSHASLTAYSAEMWVDSNTPAGDTIEIGVGSAAMGGTEQGALAAETTAPSGVSFTPAVDPDNTIFLGDIPPLTGRSIWIKRIVPAATSSFSNNTYTLRMSFFSNAI